MRETAIKRFDLSGRLALVTGSSKGIGFAIARGLAEAGAELVLNARNESVLEEARARLAAEGHKVHARAFDVTDAVAVTAAVDAIESEIGPIEILFNNAGTQFRAPLEEFPLDAWERLKATNIDSVFHVGQAVARRMIPRGHGKIVNIASVQSELARTSIAPYTATKGAVKMLTKGMATDWARYGLQVNAIGPGYFNTELNAALVADANFTAWLEKRTPAGRWAEVEELIGAAVFLASDASSFVNGHVLYVDGGITASL
ncbi:SDR family oxidoreductase [Mesorhizobium sp. WSM4906]|uniref:SDR family oxidoreductase n=1 Tax=Mesorhizobium sp. WSM4906 TaxID=3038546 RepID=UPI00241667D0|nr:SDR family oxidoreductase [Mesorhizobium sp. WSM4906]WFP79282.1 SDR family oxidoreductase [Mesorhizobium sp. WSM4906]